jgi:hypothetical protein
MTCLVTVMIPTRKRVGKLLATLDQLDQSASNRAYETLVRIDEDDRETIAAIQRIESHHATTCVIGPRLGYSELDQGYFAGMELRANGAWVWIGGDDMLVTGDWFGELLKVPLHGHIVQPQFSRLGGSVYPMAEAQAFPIFPRFCWKKYVPVFPKPFDTVGSDMLLGHGWKTWFLHGVTMWHDRPPEAEVQMHRLT